MIVIINYGVGNTGSILNMLKKIGAEAVISNDAELIARAGKLILPGVGAFDVAMERLRNEAFFPVLERRVLEDKTPLLGICLGMQILGRRSEEGNLPGLSWLPSDVVRFRFNPVKEKRTIPHMSWNRIQVKKQHPLLAGLENESKFYFVHSYHMVCDQVQDVLAETDYVYPFCSAVQRDNICGVQFHPEKSHRYGMRLLKNFCAM